MGEGHRGAGLREDGAWRAMGDRVSEGGGQRGRMAGRGAGARGGAMSMALWGGMGGRDGRGSSPRGAGEQVAICGLLSYPIEQGKERGIEGRYASGFGLRASAIRP